KDRAFADFPAGRIDRGRIPIRRPLLFFHDPEQRKNIVYRTVEIESRALPEMLRDRIAVLSIARGIAERGCKKVEVFHGAKYRQADGIHLFKIGNFRAYFRLSFWDSY